MNEEIGEAKTAIERALRRDYRRYVSAGESAMFFGEQVKILTAEDRLAVIGWLAESNRWWREFATRERNI